MIPLLSLHAIAAQRGDGLHPVLLAGLARRAADRVDPFAVESVREQETRTGEPAVDRPVLETIARPPGAA